MTATLRKAQIGKETTHGDSVAATTRLLGKFTHKEVPEFDEVEEHTGMLSKHIRAATKTGTIAEIGREGTFTFEQAPYFLGMCIKGGVVGEQVDASAAYRWAYERNLSGVNDPDSYTWEIGNAVQAFKTKFGLGKSLEVGGVSNKLLTLKCDMFGQDFSKCNFTPALSLPVVEDAVTRKTGLYLDDTAAALGTTQVSSTLLDFNWKLDTGMIPDDCCDGELWFTDFTEVSTMITLEMTFKFNNGANLEYEKYYDKQPRFMRLITQGSEIEPGYAKSIKLDACFDYRDWGALEEDNGRDTVKIKMESLYDPTWGKEWLIEVVNALSTLP
ncbi:MAG: hypothetical protein SVY53_05990 [Chloroflexota bacterium]|nr:hypothetical protein [Chloroflexota bacterium]